MRLLASLALGFIGLTAGALFEDTSSAPDLRPHEFRSLIKDNIVVLADFYATFAPKYEAAAKTLIEQNVDVKLAKVDCQKYSSFCQEYGIRAYPTLKIFKGGEELYHEYDGPRRASSIVEFAKKQTLPTVSVLATKGQHDGFLAKESGEVVLIGYFDRDDKASHTTLYAAAERLHEDIPIGVTSDRSAAAAAGVSFPAVVMHKPNDEGRVTYAGAPDDVEAIKTFAKTTYSPLIGELGQETWRTYLSGAGGPTAFIFARTDAERKALADELRPLAKRFRGSLTFATADVPDFSGFAGHLHLENHAEKDFPALAVYNGASKGKFPFPAQGDADALKVSKVGPFVEDFLGGRMAPAVLSEPLPPASQGGEGSAVTKVVANSFGSVVLDDSRDVLIYYHRDDCPYCQALNPVYESIAAAYGPLDKVVVAKMDIMRNDVPEDIPYIPYVKLYKAGDKANSLLYQGARTFQEIVKFVKENGSHRDDPAHEQVGLDNAGGGGGGGAQKPMADVEPLQGVTPVKHIHDEL